MPTYFLSFFPIPAEIANRIEKLQRDFLWGGIGEASKLHLVKWADICKLLKFGGLGIRNLRRFNQALLGKWLWRYGAEVDHLWRRVIAVKYGNEWGGWCTKGVSEPYGVSLWRSIGQGWPTFSKFILFYVGVGNRVKFWLDLWHGDSTLKEAFLELYGISCNKGYSIAKVKSFPNLLLHRDIQFSRPIQDWVLEPLTAFMDFLYSLPLKGEDEINFVGNQLRVKVSRYFSIILPCPQIWRSFSLELCVAFKDSS